MPDINLINLDSAHIPLTGKHLIEASAGTGKTYNITRIYLRLLLERELTVEQILLMTFTKDATQELRGRIDAFIRLALNDWDLMCEGDPYFIALNQRIDKTKREFLLKRALLFLDEAAIFTIHGFCQRVLNQYAFTSGLPFNANMAANSSDLTLQVCQDWYRSLAKSNSEHFSLVAEFWKTPESFLSSFNKAIGHTSELSVIDVESIEAEFIQLVRQSLQALRDNSHLLETALILVKKGAEQEKRRSELAALLTWLERIISKDLSLLSLTKEPMPDSFFHGGRYGKNKAELTPVFSGVKDVKAQVKNIGKNINKAKAFSIVKSGIYSIREKVIAQKQALNLLDFDDLINTLANCLAQEQSAGVNKNHHEKTLAKQLLNQFPVALIDEFQDTDPKQFGILQAIYYGEPASKADAGLFLIGDPKQAIYGFRGGDIFAYLNARGGCDHHWLMDTNWRSTADMITGYNQLFSIKAKGLATDDDLIDTAQQSESVFGYGIPYLPVLAGKSTGNDTHVINDADKALQFVQFTDEQPVPSKGKTKAKVKQSARPLLAKWCANEIVNLLTTSNTSEGNANSAAFQQATKPKDIAVLVRDGAEARDIKQALQDAGLDCVFLSDRSNLFHSPQAKQLLSLLKGILLPENERLFVAALSCGLLGYDAAKLHQLQQDEIAYQSLKFSFVDYRSQWQRHGFITMAITLTHHLLDVPENNKDRCLTNLLHLFEVLQAASVRLSQGQELLHWFDQQCHIETNDVEAELRLESDGDLIRLITQHGSKGLEYPYVFIPFATRHKDPLKFAGSSVNYLEYHDKAGKLCLSLDGSKEAKKAMSDEAYAESIRLLYVAITRAERRCYVFCCEFDDYHLSPLGKTLQLTEETSIDKPLQLLKTAADNAICIRQVSLASLAGTDADTESSELDNDASISRVKMVNPFEHTQVSQFNGKIERDWWLSSFTALSRNIRHAGISNPDRDTETSTLLSEQDSTAALTANKICFKLAKGAHTGNLLHDVLEHTDFSAPNWQESFEKPLQKYGELSPSVPTGDNIEVGEQLGSANPFTTEDLIDWLEEVINTPLISVGVNHNGNKNNDTSNITSEDVACLAELNFNKTLRESEFYFPMEGKGTGTLANLLTDHRNSAPRNKNAIHPVMLPSYQRLSGMMHGFIDLIFEHQGRYYICDYKSNHLGDNYNDYHFDALLDNVEKNYYDLQYLIYSLALHRYLTLNFPDYQISKHFGGVYYLYLRGMTTVLEHKGAGVYYRHITEQEIYKLDTLFSSEVTSTEELKDA